MGQDIGNGIANFLSTFIRASRVHMFIDSTFSGVFNAIYAVSNFSTMSGWLVRETPRILMLFSCLLLYLHFLCCNDKKKITELQVEAWAFFFLFNFPKTKTWIKKNQTVLWRTFLYNGNNNLLWKFMIQWPRCLLNSPLAPPLFFTLPTMILPGLMVAHLASHRSWQAVAASFMFVWWKTIYEVNCLSYTINSSDHPCLSCGFSDKWK